METILLLVHVFLALGLVVLVLLQRSEGGALGIGGGGAMDGLVSARGAGNLLTRWTGILAACFIATSLILAITAGNNNDRKSIVDQPISTKQPTPESKPTKPLVPVGK
ncbi:MAG: preprotein translocase subunit SecG [Rhodospirillaceae bacterium]|mgnify:CR=1 FL=1|nr:preprotein translocase subunit SecG [Rhodospirillaceae bacterium]|tara:strand:- start:1058 stop:1381 length:324 start_codon:yes stop_codon:yes gene_type:complete